MLRSRFTHLLVVLAVAGLSASRAAPVRDGHVEAELIAENATIRAGEPFAVGLRLRMDDHWHTYWQNPGDSGMPTTIAWTLPPGFTAGEIQWPVPVRDVTPELVSYIYNDEVLLIVDITPPANLAAGTSVTLQAKTEWLVCREACMPGAVDVELTLSVSTDTPAPHAATAPLFASARAQHPVSGDAAWGGSFTVKGDAVTLSVPLPAGTTVDASSVYFYPTVTETIAALAPQTARIESGRLVVQLTKSEYATDALTQLDGVLTAPGGFPPTYANRGIAVHASPGDGSTTNSGAVPAEETSFSGLLLWAFLGGLILNLMPCVFPVIGIKIMGFVNQAGSDRRKVTMHGVMFTTGVLVSFWILAGALIMLRAGGQELGWGFQLQSPAFVYGLAIFLLAFGMNMSGAFEFGLAATSVGGSLQMKSGLTGSFFSGVLATVVSTPCAAPFLAPALGAALSMKALPSLTLFTFIALGLSGPYLFLSIFPQFVKLLPRPGAWMETFKQFMAFPLYATVAYLVYVLTKQVKDDDALMLTIGSFVVVALGLWGYGRWTQNGAVGKRRVFGFAFTIACIGAGLAFGYPGSGKSDWQDWSPGLPEKLSAEGKIVYVDFTAAWCATCKVNKLRVLNTDEIKREFEQRNIVRLKADWTNRNEEIARALASFNRAAVPLNVIYGPGLDEPVLLPELLTKANVLEAMERATAASAAPSGSGT